MPAGSTKFGDEYTLRPVACLSLFSPGAGTARDSTLEKECNASFLRKASKSCLSPWTLVSLSGGRVLDAGKEAVGEWPDASPSLCRCSPERIFDLGQCGGAVWLWLWQQLAGRQSFAGVVVFSRPSRDKTHQWIQWSKPNALQIACLASCGHSANLVATARGTFRLFLPLSALPLSKRKHREAVGSRVIEAMRHPRASDPRSSKKREHT